MSFEKKLSVSEIQFIDLIGSKFQISFNNSSTEVCIFLEDSFPEAYILEGSFIEVCILEDSSIEVCIFLEDSSTEVYIS